MLGRVHSHNAERKTSTEEGTPMKRIGRSAAYLVRFPALFAVVLLLAACAGEQTATTAAPVTSATTTAPVTSTTTAQAATTTEATSGVSTTSQPARTAVGTIAFARVNDEGTHSGWGDLWVINTDGSGLRQLTATSDASEEQPSWSSDGSRIAYAKGMPGSALTLRVMNADGSGDGHLTGAPLAGLNPKWCSDGTRIVFGDPGTWNPTIMNADGSGVEAVTFDSTYKFLPNWLPDGTLLYLEFGAAIDLRLSADGWVFGDIFRVNADGSGLTKVTKDGRVAYYAVSPDGTQLAIHDNLWNRLIILPVDGEKTPVVLVEYVSKYVSTKTVSLAWSPDGKAIAFAGSLMFGSLGGSPIYIVNADGSGLHQVPNTEHSADVAWRPE
jgi:Tol biopolymer transport system component